MQNSINALIVFLTCVTISCVVLQLEKKCINFIMTFAHFSLKKESQTEASLLTDIIFYWYFVGFFQKIIKSIKNLFSNVVPSSMANCKERKNLPTMSIFFRQNCVFYRMEIPRIVLKQPIRIECLIKQKPRGALALQVNRITDRRVS